MNLFTYAARRTVLALFAAFVAISLTFIAVAANRFQPVEATLLEQYLTHMENLLVFDWGRSESLREPVGDILVAAVPRTLAYTIPAILLTYALAVVAGLAATYGTAGRDLSMRVFAYVLLGVPMMVFGSLLVFQLTGTFDWLSHPVWCTGTDPLTRTRCWPPFVRRGFPLLEPVQWGREPSQGWPNTVPWRSVSLKYLLPAFVLSAGIATGLFRHVRNQALAHRHSQSAKMLRAKGGNTLVEAKHALRNAALPLLEVSFAELLSVIALWSFVVEALFHIPGVTAYAQIAVRMRDIPLLVGTATVLVLVTIALSLVQDILYGILDPKTGTT
jgi:peptide/nickel transport system permease protein